MQMKKFLMIYIIKVHMVVLYKIIKTTLDRSIKKMEEFK